MSEKARRTKKVVQQSLESLQRAGITQLGKQRRRGGPPPELVDDAPADPAAEPCDPGGAAHTLDLLRAEVAQCRRCSELADQRTQTVFGVGNPAARLCFLGEAPGAEEDRLGEPFVGAAGRLLTRIIEACHMRRDDVYILNILKCRPPGNRNPSALEAAHCRPFLHRQLDLIQPEFLCCLGTVAAQNLLETSEAIGRLRGRFFTYRESRVVCTYHPAYLLRNPPAKKLVWDDMKMLMAAMGLAL